MHVALLGLAVLLFGNFIHSGITKNCPIVSSACFAQCVSSDLRALVLTFLTYRPFNIVLMLC